MLNEVQKSLDKVYNSSIVVNTKLTDGIEIATIAKEKFTKINKFTDLVVSRIGDISEGTVCQEELSNEVVKFIYALTNGATGTSNISEEILSRIVLQNKKLIDINSYYNELEGLVEKLNIKTRQFKI
jgi:methyl-accepting chemotaxis protein